MQKEHLSVRNRRPVNSVLEKKVSEEIKKKVVEIYTRYRKNPNEAYDESHFLDYLIRSPKYKGALQNSFFGLRRLHRFLDEVQLEFLICFRFNDRDKNYSLEEFVERIVELKNNKRKSLAALRYQMKQEIEWNVFLVMNLLMFVPAGFFYTKIISFLGYATFVVFVNYKFFSSYSKSKKYLKVLYQEISKN